MLKCCGKGGVQHEENIISQIGPYTDLSKGTREERFEKTLQAMKAGDALIYQGVLMDDELLGIPDLLKRQQDGTYMPVDIKSGMGFEGTDEDTGEEGRPKKHYALQLCLYVNLIIRLGFSKQKRGAVIDIVGDETLYPLDASMGPRTPQTYWSLTKKLRPKWRVCWPIKKTKQTCHGCQLQDVWLVFKLQKMGVLSTMT